MAKKKSYRYVRIEDRSGRKSPYGVIVKGDRRSEWFSAKEDRDKKAARLERKIASEGTELLRVDLGLHRKLLHWMERYDVGPGDLESVGAVWKKFGRPSSRLTVSQAVDQYLEHVIDDVAEDSYRHIRKNLRRFAEAAPMEKISDVTPEWLQQWLTRGLGHFADYTRRSHRKDARAMCNYLLKRGLINQNPVEQTHPIRVVRDPVTVLSVEDGRKLFGANKSNPVVGRLALEAFAMMRNSTAGQMLPEFVDWESNGFEFPPGYVKSEKRSGRRKYRSGFPGTAFRWMEHAGPAMWDLSGKDYERAKGLAFERAEVHNPGNVLRHTAITAYYAMTGDLARASEFALHSSIKRTDDDYAGRMSKVDGEAWFDILP